MLLRRLRNGIKMTEEQGLDLWFPTSVYWARNILSKEENEKLKQVSLDIKEKHASTTKDWKCNVISTFGTFNPWSDETFSLLLERMSNHVHRFAQLHNSFEKYYTNVAWLNFNDKEHYQEFHTHNSYIVSAIYYITAPEGSAPTTFKTIHDDMLPMKNITKCNELSTRYIHYQAEEGKLLLFRSNIPHLVPQGTNNDIRITLSANFR